MVSESTKAAIDQAVEQYRAAERLTESQRWLALALGLSAVVDRAPAAVVKATALREALARAGVPDAHIPGKREFARVVCRLTGAQRYMRGGASWFRGIGLVR